MAHILYTAEVPESITPFVTFDSEGKQWTGRTQEESIRIALENGVLLKKQEVNKIESGLNFAHFSQEDFGFLNKDHG